MASGGDDYQKALVDNFMAVTGAGPERASFFLGSAAWNLQVMFQARAKDVNNYFCGTSLLAIIWLHVHWFDSVNTVLYL